MTRPFVAPRIGQKESVMATAETTAEATADRPMTPGQRARADAAASAERMLRGGASDGEVARRFGRSITWASLIRRHAGLAPRNGTGRVRVADWARAIVWRARGHSFEDIATRIGTTKQYVAQLIAGAERAGLIVAPGVLAALGDGDDPVVVAGSMVPGPGGGRPC